MVLIDAASYRNFVLDNGLGWNAFIEIIKMVPGDLITKAKIALYLPKNY